MRRWFQLLTLLFFFASPNMFSQQAPVSAPANAGAVARPAVDRRILLDVVVTDKSGNVIPGLQREDFSVLDDTQPRSILSFSASPSKNEDRPVQAIFVVDAVNVGFQGVSTGVQELQNFLRRDGGHLPIPMSLVFFTDKSTQVQPTPTQDGNALIEALNVNQTGLRSNNRSQGFYGAVDRLQMSLRTLEQLSAYEAKQPGKKLLIWISPGWPLLSGPRVELSVKNEEWIFDNVVALSGALRQARITLYNIDPFGMADAGSFRTFSYQSYLKGVRSAKKAENGNLALQVIAVQSGGRVLNSSNDLAGSIAKCVAEAQAYYTLSFDSPPADGPNEYHNLQVKVDKPGLTARTRTGYYAQP